MASFPISKNPTSKHHNYRYDRLYVRSDNVITRLRGEEDTNGAQYRQLHWADKLARGTQGSYYSDDISTIHGTSVKDYNSPLIIKEANGDDVIELALVKKVVQYRDLAITEFLRPEKEKVRHELGYQYVAIVERLVEVLKSLNLQVPELPYQDPVPKYWNIDRYNKIGDLYRKYFTY